MNKIVITLLLIVACTASAYGQTFLEHLQKQQQGQGIVTVTQSKELDNLVNGVQPKMKTDKDSLKKDTIQKEVIKDSIATEKPHRKLVRKERDPNEENTDVKSDNRMKVMRGTHKVNGYRVQVYSGGNTRADREKAYQARTKAKQTYPSLPAYAHFFSPHWKCLVGNFIDYKEAEKVLKQMKALGFKQAIIVKSKISVH